MFLKVPLFDFSGPPWTDFGGRSMKPAASASSFRIFYKNENFVTPLWKMRFPRKNVDTWPPTPQQKSEWSVLFSSSHIFVFFFNLRFVRNFCGYRKFDCTRIYADADFQNSQTSKIGGFKNLAYNVDKFSKSPIFEVCEFWKICICINSSTIEFSISAEISNKA